MSDSDHTSGQDKKVGTKRSLDKSKTSSRTGRKNAPGNTDAPTDASRDLEDTLQDPEPDHLSPDSSPSGACPESFRDRVCFRINRLWCRILSPVFPPSEWSMKSVTIRIVAWILITAVISACFLGLAGLSQSLGTRLSLRNSGLVDRSEPRVQLFPGPSQDDSGGTDVLEVLTTRYDHVLHRMASDILDLRTDMDNVQDQLASLNAADRASSSATPVQEQEIQRLENAIASVSATMSELQERLLQPLEPGGATFSGTQAPPMQDWPTIECSPTDRKLYADMANISAFLLRNAVFSGTSYVTELEMVTRIAPDLLIDFPFPHLQRHAQEGIGSLDWHRIELIHIALEILISTPEDHPHKRERHDPKPFGSGVEDQELKSSLRRFMENFMIITPIDDRAHHLQHTDTGRALLPAEESANLIATVAEAYHLLDQGNVHRAIAAMRTLDGTSSETRAEQWADSMTRRNTVLQELGTFLISHEEAIHKAQQGGNPCNGSIDWVDTNAAVSPKPNARKQP